MSRLHAEEANQHLNALLNACPAPIGSSQPPDTNGVYAFSIADEIIYVGEASGSGGLRDRIKRKHVSGDNGHALQKALSTDFPDRAERREHIKSSVFVQWVEIPDSLMVSLVERLGILTLLPKLNSHVNERNHK